MTKTTSTIKCPHCGHEKEEILPTESCAPFYVCENCGETLTAKEGECCVFCSYGDTKCPDKQENE